MLVPVENLKRALNGAGEEGEDYPILFQQQVPYVEGAVEQVFCVASVVENVWSLKPAGLLRNLPEDFNNPEWGTIDPEAAKNGSTWGRKVLLGALPSHGSVELEGPLKGEWVGESYVPITPVRGKVVDEGKMVAILLFKG